MREKIKALLFKNTSTKQTVAKNTFWLSVSNFGGRIIKAVIVIYGARVLGTAGWGVFSYAVTLAGFLTLFMDPGINGILMRDASKANEEDRRAIFSTTFLLKIVLILIGIGIVLIIAPLFSTLPGAKALLPIVAIILAIDTLREFFSSLIRSMEKMEWEAAVFLLTNLGIVIFGFIFLWIAATAKSFAWSYVAGDIVGTTLAIILLSRYFKNLLSAFSPKLILPILKSAWPFAISGALGILFTNSDILIISWIKAASDVGIYSAAIRVIQTLYLIPSIIQFTTLPLLARLAKKDDVKFRSALEQTLSIVFFASIPLALGGVILGTPIMGLLFGPAYQAGSMAFKILMLTLLFDFPASIIINALFAYDHQKSLIISSALGGTTNVVLDLILIPAFGITGSAVATLIAQAINNGYLWGAMKKVNQFTITTRLKNIFIASFIMAGCTLLFMVTGINVIINIALSICIYFILLRWFKEPLLIEIKNVVIKTS